MSIEKDNENHPAGHKSGGILRALIESLHQLQIALSSKLRHAHLSSSKPTGEMKESADIWKRLEMHLEETQTVKPEDEKPDHMHISQREELPDIKTHQADQEQNPLSDFYAHKASASPHTHMDEQMQKNTMEHLNRALHLARRGDKEGAKVHAELAETAMETASQFMTHEEYEAFHTEVEKRLESLVSKGHQD